MNALLLVVVLAEISQSTLLILAVAANLFVFFLFVGIWASRFRKVGPDEVMIVSGRKYEVITADGRKAVAGFRIVRGGGTFIWPIFEQEQTLSLKVIPFAIEGVSIATKDEKRLQLQAKGQIRIKADDVSVMRAAQALGSKTPSEIAEAASLIVEGFLRKSTEGHPAADITREFDRLAAQVQSAAQSPLDDLGLELVALSIVVGRAT